MRSTILVFLSCLTFVVMAGAGVAPSTSAGEHAFKATIVIRLTSLEQVGGQLVIEAQGAGVSRLLGVIRATALVTQAAFPDPCYPFGADFDLSADQGSIRIHSEGLVCSPPDQISGTWSVIAGTGAFSGATGSGTEEGKYSFSGEDPVVDQLEGTLFYEDTGSSVVLTYQQCVALNDLYSKAFGEAKECNPLADRRAQCTERLSSDLICGCSGYVNSRDKRDLRIMDAASQLFEAAGCSGFFDCTAGLCPGIYGADCEGEGAQGTCADWWGW